MESVLTAPVEHEILTRAPKQITTPSRRDKKVAPSSNGGPPKRTSLISSRKTDTESYSDESEGWRYIERLDKNGQVEYERVPLTRYELLHPEEDYISPEQIWSTFNCEEEGVYPSVVFEVTSPGTRESDFGEKYDYYCRAGIPYYVILDIQYEWNGPSGTANYHLHVFERIEGQYEEMQTNSEGRYWLPPLKMWVGTGEKGILCYDGSGKLLLAPEDLARTLDETERRLDAAVERADE